MATGIVVIFLLANEPGHNPRRFREQEGTYTLYGIVEFEYRLPLEHSRFLSKRPTHGALNLIWPKKVPTIMNHISQRHRRHIQRLLWIRVFPVSFIELGLHVNNTVSSFRYVLCDKFRFYDYYHFMLPAVQSNHLAWSIQSRSKQSLCTVPILFRQHCQELYPITTCK